MNFLVVFLLKINFILFLLTSNQFIMKSLYTLLILSFSFLFHSCDAQISNPQTTSVRIYGNCGMCKKRIEKAGNVDGIAKVVWNKDTEMAEITISKGKTTADEVLKRIAAVGHDSDDFRAQASVYNNLHECCKYDRPE